MAFTKFLRGLQSYDGLFDFYILPMQLLLYAIWSFFLLFLSQEQIKVAVKEDRERGLEEDIVIEKDQSKEMSMVRDLEKGWMKNQEEKLEIEKEQKKDVGIV